MAADDALLGQLFLALLLSAFNMGLFAGLDARREGRSFIVWFLVGFLLAPFGLLVWLFVRSNRPADAPTGAPCAVCTTPMREGARYCGQCGTAREATSLTPDASGARRAASERPDAAPAGTRRYAVLTALSRAAARNPGVDLRDLVERARSARSASEFDAIEKELATRAPVPPNGPRDESG